MTDLFYFIFNKIRVVDLIICCSKNLLKEMGPELIEILMPSAFGNSTCSIRDDIGWTISKERNKDCVNLELSVLTWESMPTNNLYVYVICIWIHFIQLKWRLLNEEVEYICYNKIVTTRKKLRLQYLRDNLPKKKKIIGGSYLVA